MRIIVASFAIGAFALVAALRAGADTRPANDREPAAPQAVTTIPSVLLPAALRSKRALWFLTPKPRATPRSLCRTYGADASVKCQIVTCEFGQGACIAYTTTGTILATRSGFANPQGVAADRQNNTYVANTGLSNILEYSRSLAKLEKTYQDKGQFPVDVDIDVPGHLLAVSNIGDTSGGPGSVSVYAGGATSPTATLTDPSVSAQGIAIAVDKFGNCFWSLNDTKTGRGQIDEFKGCSGPPHLIQSGLGFAGGLAFDQSNTLYYADQLAGAIYKCTAQNQCSLLASGFSDPVMINFDDRWKYLWVADAGTGTIDAVNRSTGQVAASFQTAGGTNDPPIGVAHAPGPLY